MTLFQFTDWLGTRRVQTDALGSPEEICSGGAFGDALNCTGEAATNRHFTGQERDAETEVHPGTNDGLDYFGARHYSSALGRFISPDPSGLAFADPSNPQSFNLYSYAWNNPLINIDPTGLDCVYIDPDSGQYQGYSAGDCDNSTTALANSGYYFDGTVSTIYTTTGDTSGQVVGVQGMSDQTGDNLYLSNPAGLSFSQPNSKVLTFGMNTVIDTWGDFSQTTQFNHGTHPFRDNNPGDIVSSKFVTRHGAIGVDGRFGVFSSVRQGNAALDALLHGPTYFNLNINAAVKIYAPKFENNTAGYQQFLTNVVGVSGNTPISALSPSQLSALENGIAHYEGFNARGNYSITVTTNF